FADFYGLVKKLLLLGRVSSGKGGDLVIEVAQKVVKEEFPEIASQLEFKVPDEEFKRHGQAMIAASLPELN
ncbi:MAG: ROK family protein, partial [Lentisphaeria bacterium]|nr:ROK family protein [Lentisphaeria bacterium]